MTIWIKATRCNGIVECKNGEDEDFCSLPSWISFLVLAITILISSILAFLMHKTTLKDFKLLSTTATIEENNFKTLHRTGALKSLMHQVQGSTNSKLMNHRYMALEIQHHNGSTSQTVCCIKNSLSPSGTAGVMKDFLTNQKESSHSGKHLKILKGILRKVK